MALNKSIEGISGEYAVYHRISIDEVGKTKVYYSVTGYISESEANDKARSCYHKSYSFAISSSEYNEGIKPSVVYADLKTNAEFLGATDV